MNQSQDQSSQPEFLLKLTPKQNVINELSKHGEKLSKEQLQNLLARYHDNPSNTEIVSEQLYSQILGQIQQWNVKQYQRYYFQEKNSLQLLQISHIFFSDLIQLKLFSIKICNIQPLDWLNAPNLLVLDLQGNHITSLKTLSKLKLQNLCQINLNFNHFTHDELSNFTRMKTSSINIINLSFTQIPSPGLSVIDIPQQLMKLESPQITNTMILSTMISKDVLNNFSEKFRSRLALRNSYKVLNQIQTYHALYELDEMDDFD